MRSVHLVFLLLALTVSGVAQACSIYIPPEERLERAFDEGTIAGVAEVKILTARHLREAVADTHPWRAQARKLKSMFGDDLPETVEFERGWGSAACEWNLPALPRPGDTWIIYFWVDRSGTYRPWLALSLIEAMRFDPLLLEREKAAGVD